MGKGYKRRLENEPKVRENLGKVKDTSVLCKCGQRVYGVECRHCGRKRESS